MLETTVAGSLPKPFWLATPRMLWPPWRESGAALEEAKRDATILALKEQEAAGEKDPEWAAHRDQFDPRRRPREPVAMP